MPAFSALLAAALAIWVTWPPLARTWLDMADYQHGWLVTLLIVVWLYRIGPSLPLPTGRLATLGGGLLLLALLAWLVAYRALSSIGQQLLVPPILWLAVWSSCGWPTARRVVAPLACLYFVIPVWELLLPGLQRLSVFVAESLLSWLGVPVSIEGVFITIPEGSFQIAEGCAGKRYLIVALAVAGLIAGMMRMRWQRALLFFATTALLALLTNWLRILIVVYAGHLTDMQSYLVAREHISLGWVLFAVLVALVCVLGNRLAGAHAVVAAAPPASVVAPPQASLWRALLATVPLLLVPLSAQLYTRYSIAPRAGLAAVLLPVADREWHGPLAPDARWTPRFRGASSESRGAYTGVAGEVQIFVAQYGVQSDAGKLISFNNSLYTPGWVQLRTGTLTPSAASARAQSTAALWVLAPTGEQWLISYVFQVGDVVTANPVVAQLAYGMLSWRRALASRVLVVAAPCATDCESAQRAVADFWSSGPRLFM